MGHDNATILIVEDDSGISETLRQILVGRNVEFLLADSLAKARDIIGKSEVSIIILDRVLPDGDGVGLLKELKTTPALNKIPVMILSGKTEVSAQVEGLDLGADDYMSKPFSVPELKARVDALLRRSKKFIPR